MTQLLQCNLACGLEIVVELELLLLEIVNVFFIIIIITVITLGLCFSNFGNH